MTTKSKKQQKSEATDAEIQNDNAGKTSILFDDKEYFLEDMTQEQQAIVSHVSDLEAKIQKSQFDLNQYNVGKQGFIDMLKKSLDSEGS
jgi:hypothetical protein